SLDDLPADAKIGTGSKRREYQLGSIYKEYEFLPIRGNIHTRLRKLEEEEYDAIVLAMAGLKRVGLDKKLGDRVHPLDPEQILPSPAQGALAIEIRQGDDLIHSLLESIKHEDTQIQMAAERSFLKTIGG